MPRYLVRQHRDACKNWYAIIDADSPAAAKAKADVDDCTWIEGDVHQFDDREIPLDGVEEVEATFDTLPAAAPTITVAVIQHKFGTDISAFATHDLAIAAVAKFAREWWHQELGSGIPCPPDDARCIKEYFERVDGEYVDIQDVAVTGAEGFAISIRTVSGHAPPVSSDAQVSA